MGNKNKKIYSFVLLCGVVLFFCSACTGGRGSRSSSYAAKSPKVYNCACYTATGKSVEDACISASNKPTCMSSCSRGGYKYSRFGYSDQICEKYKWKWNN